MSESLEIENVERIPTSLRVLRVLETLAEAGQPLSIQAIGTKLGLAKPTIYRLCSTLLDEGYLIREFETGYVRPAAKTVTLGNGLVSASRINWVRKQVLTVLSKSVGETCNVAVPEGTGMIYLERVETQWPLRIQLPIGTQVPMHCTASGKLFLSTLPKRKRLELINVLEMETMAKNTISNADTLIEETELISAQGFATDDEEFMDGLVALAVPVRDPNGHFCAALAFHAPVIRMDITKAKSYLEFMQQAARRLEREVFQDIEQSTMHAVPKF